MALFSIVWKKIGQITHLSICEGIYDIQMYVWHCAACQVSPVGQAGQKTCNFMLLFLQNL